MLPKQSRLTKKEIETHLLRGKRLNGPFFTFIYNDISGLKGPKISVSVPKKVAPKAATRNLIRRRAYSALRAVIPLVSPTLIGLVLWSSKDTKISIDDLRGEFSRLFKSSRGFMR